MSEKEKQGFLSRVGTYGKRRVQGGYEHRRSKLNLNASYSLAKEALKPQKITKEEALTAIKGRHEDGGVARFAEEMATHEIPDEELPIREKEHLRLAYIYAAAAAFSLGFGLYSLFTAEWGFHVAMAAIGPLIMLLFTALAARHDYSAWCIRERRFGGLADYLNSRWGI